MKAFQDQMVEFDARRQSARVTDEEIADRAGVQPSTISHYRCGRRQPLVDGWARLNTALDELIHERANQMRQLSRQTDYRGADAD